MSDGRSFRERLPDRSLVGAWCFAILAWAALGLVIITPWTFAVSMRHFVSALGCDAARVAGLAHARRGQPGYWPWLDANHDGTACAVISPPRLRAPAARS